MYYYDTYLIKEERENEPIKPKVADVSLKSKTLSSLAKPTPKRARLL